MMRIKRWVAVFIVVVGLGACGDPGPSNGDTGSSQGSDPGGRTYN
jgi:hypothetical protein